VAVISAAHTQRQRQALTTLAEVMATVQREQLASPAVLVVGDVVQLAAGWLDAATPAGPAASAG
jgi:uroporphyrin-III C-methyltransferase